MGVIYAILDSTMQCSRYMFVSEKETFDIVIVKEYRIGG